ncbi:metallophosphoesterase [Candidatus Pacearchaeota archaeon]|nr:metallophosphoesterase [Candidatus Pacearchaeota archaeon]
MATINKIILLGKSAFLEDAGILVFGDLHLGYEEGLNDAGVLIPRTMFKEMMDELGMIFGEIDKEGKTVRKIVVLGDLKHEFGSVLYQEWSDVSQFLKRLKEKVKDGEVILIKGNHDTILEPIVKREGLELKDFYVDRGYGFLHGHKMFDEILDKNVKTIFVGHMHPAITLRESVKSERYKCFLAGKWKGKKLIVTPSFFPFVEGADIFYQEGNLAMKVNVKNMDVYVVGSGLEVLRFGKMRRLEER